MKRLVLHIGSGKCGSSSIQSYLGLNFTQQIPKKNKKGETVAYAAILHDKVVVGPDLLAQQKISASGYVSSERLRKESADEFRAKLTQLCELTSNIHTIVLSCEGWVQEAEVENARLFLELGIPTDLVLVTRPPVELMIAAWWQWGAWTGLPVEKWCRSQLSLVDFQSSLSKWTSHGIGSRVKVIELSQDPIREFVDFLGFEATTMPAAGIRNAATNAQLLRHLIRSKSRYRRSVHQPAIEFRLNDVLRLPLDKPPMVFPPSLARHILTAVLESSNQILGAIRAQGAVIDDDIVNRYLNVDYYQNATFSEYEEWIAQENSDEFVSELVNNILHLDRSLREIRKSLDRVESTWIWQVVRRLQGLRALFMRISARDFKLED